MSKPHFDALEALIPDTLTVYRGAAPIVPSAEEFPYVVLGGTPGREYTESLSRKPDAIDLRFKITLAALTFDSVLIHLSEVRGALIGSRLIVPGWNTDPLQQETLIDVTTDKKVTVPVVDLHPVFAVDEYTALSTR